MIYSIMNRGSNSKDVDQQKSIYNQRYSSHSNLIYQIVLFSLMLQSYLRVVLL